MLHPSARHGLVLALLVACSPDLDGVVGDGGSLSSGGAGGDGGSSTNTTSTNAGGAQTNATSSNAGGNAQTNASSTNASSTSTSSTNTTEATTSTDPTTTSMEEATNQTVTTSSNPDPVMVHCGDTSCDVDAGEACCFDYEQEEADCSQSGNCSGSDTTLTCDEPADCASGVCCAYRQFSGTLYEATFCSESCNPPSRVICTLGGPPCQPIDLGGFMVDTTCKQSDILPPGYMVCATM